jgi:hypothetical protein
LQRRAKILFVHVLNGFAGCASKILSKRRIQPPAAIVRRIFDMRYKSLSCPKECCSNEFYARDTSKKIRAVNQAKAQRGERVNGELPYGYIADPDDRKRWVIDEEAGDIGSNLSGMLIVVRTIF